MGIRLLLFFPMFAELACFFETLGEEALIGDVMTWMRCKSYVFNQATKHILRFYIVWIRVLFLGKDLGESERPWYANRRRVELLSAHRWVCHPVYMHTEYLWGSHQLHWSINVTLEKVHGKFERFVAFAGLPLAKGLQKLVLVQLSWHGDKSL